MSEAAIGVGTFLRNPHPIGQERHDDLAHGRIAGNERRDVAFDVCLADGLANVRVTAASHPLAVELHFQLVMTERENPKIVATIAIEAVYLGWSDHLRWSMLRFRRDYRFLRPCR